MFITMRQRAEQKNQNCDLPTFWIYGPSNIITIDFGRKIVSAR